MNLAIIIGNLGRDPEVRFTQTGSSVANFSVATSRKWKDKDSGETKEQTEWHKCCAFGRTAEVAGEYLAKGSKVCVRGRLQTREWEDKEGTKRWTTEIVVDELEMLGKGRDQGGQRDEPQHDHCDDDMPF